MKRVSISRLPVAIFLLLGLVGCATQKTNVTNKVEAAKFDPNSKARIRFITDKGIFGKFSTSQSCKDIVYNGPDWIDAHTPSEGLYPFRNSDKQNTVIGMPETPASRLINKSTAYYDEYVVAAGKAVIVRMYSYSTQVSCTPPAVELVPEPGADYEVAYEQFSTGTFSFSCRTNVHKISGAGAETALQTVRIQNCPWAGK